jgi:hypothetical protein
LLERKLYKQHIEAEKWKSAYLAAKSCGKSYAHAVIHGTSRYGMAAPEKEKRTNYKQRSEIMLIRPENEEKDKQTNDKLKTDLLKELKDVKQKLKIKSIRQMKNKKLILEVDG